MGGIARHRGDQGDGGGAGPDDDDLLAPVVEILGPVLRMDDLPREVVAACELRSEALVVVVVAGAREHPAGLDLGGLARVVVLDGQGPQLLGLGPVGRHRAAVERDLRLQAVLGDGLTQVVEDAGCVGDGLGIAPRLELVPECVEIGVGADTGVPEQIPGTADGVA